MKSHLAIALGLSLSLAAPALAAPNDAVPDFGRYAKVPNGQEKPDPARDYKVVFEVSEGTPADGKPLEGLQRVARFVNLLAAGGVAADHRHVIAVLDGPATEAIMTDKAFGERHGGAANPSTKLIQELQAAGVSVRVCGQAMAGHKIMPDQVLPGVEIDVAALMTITNKQLEGYALVEE